MNADRFATGPAVPSQRTAPGLPRVVPGARVVPGPGARPAPSPRDIPAQRSTPVEVRHTPVPFAIVEPAENIGIRDAARSDVLHRHARLTKAGRPVFCTPSQAEIAGVAKLRQGRGTDGKVIYSTREDAESAARELEALGARALRSYLCGRSRSGHFHLATDTARPLTPAEVHARIPQQRGQMSA
jgi:hypothetical protein